MQEWSLSHCPRFMSGHPYKRTYAYSMIEIFDSHRDRGVVRCVAAVAITSGTQQLKPQQDDFHGRPKYSITWVQVCRDIKHTHMYTIILYRSYLQSD